MSQTDTPSNADPNEALKSLIQLANRAEANVTDLWGAALDLRDCLKYGCIPIAPAKPSNQRDPTAILKRQGESGAEEVAIRRSSDGSAEFAITRTDSLKLSPVLTDLMEVLRAPTGISEDGKVGFKSEKELCHALEKLRGRPVSKHALQQNLTRLRAKLREAGISEYLIQTNREGHHRLAVKCDE